MLGLQVDAPADGVIKLVASSDCLLQDLDGLGVSVTRAKSELATWSRRSEQTLSTNLLEHIELVGAGCHNVLEDVLEHGPALSM